MHDFDLDTIARLVGAASTRRKALGSAVASVVAGLGVASVLGGEGIRAKKKRKKKKDCTLWFLSGGSDPNTKIRVDDDLTVFRNGQIVFKDDDGGSDSHCPIFFRARRGSQLRIVAFDAEADCHELSPLHLHCLTGGSPRKLSDGVPETCPNVAVGKFFDETFTI